MSLCILSFFFDSVFLFVYFIWAYHDLFVFILLYFIFTIIF